MKLDGRFFFFSVEFGLTLGGAECLEGSSCVVFVKSNKRGEKEKDKQCELKD